MCVVKDRSVCNNAHSLHVPNLTLLVKWKLINISSILLVGTHFFYYLIKQLFIIKISQFECKNYTFDAKLI